MATVQETARREEPVYNEYEDEKGYGWVMFAGIVLMIAGTLNFIYGIAAVASSSFYLVGTHYVFSELNTWGWVLLLLGVLQVCVGIGVWMRAAWARWTGVVIASLSAIAQLLAIAANPWLSLAILALDLLVIYGLLTYGGKVQSP